MNWKWKGKVVSQQQLEMVSKYPAPSNWKLAAFRNAKAKISEDGFPCPFSKKSIKQEKAWFCFADLTEESGYSSLVQTLHEYTNLFKISRAPHNLYFPILVSIKTPDEINTLEKYNEFGWSVLQHLHDNDSYPWPHELPTDPESHLWSFVFSDVALFVNMSTPCHDKRKSRYFGEQLTFVINPRENFDHVAGDTANGREVRNNIRKRIASYDESPICQYLGIYGVEENTEWRQYAVGDDNNSFHVKSCPLKVKKNNFVTNTTENTS